jgi:hypothetical protein
MTHQDEEEKNMALNLEGGENTPDTTPVTERETTEEVEKSTVESNPTGEETTEEETTETGEGSQRKGYSQRIRELNARAKEAEARSRSLVENIEALTGPEGSRLDSNRPYQPQVVPGSEISPDQYKQDVMRTADSLVQIRLRQQEAISRINEEAIDAVREYPQLDPKSERFDKELSESVTAAVEAHVRLNPYQASVGQFVAKLMKPYNRAVTNEVGKVTEKIAKQVSETATRPTQVASGSKKFEELSIKEMEEKLGIVQ